ncbi:hypothetical protein IEQ34_016212 [Dendrobium chrysotoxum]|uniref:Uncharacterized protein n=1 Tax=Dendrobium chrysotoxum TaxID=161865 RepID=A0AAV7GEU1_DENCH|nr:hypothetical protein IEQ34_016212 [Dendrobium chrysotoxum]
MRSHDQPRDPLSMDKETLPLGSKWWPMAQGGMEGERWRWGSSGGCIRSEEEQNGVLCLAVVKNKVWKTNSEIVEIPEILSREELSPMNTNHRLKLQIPHSATTNFSEAARRHFIEHLKSNKSIIRRSQLNGKELIFWYSTDNTIGEGVGDAEESVSTFDYVFTEHALALVDGTAEKASRAGHANPELAIMRNFNSLFQCSP